MIPSTEWFRSIFHAISDGVLLLQGNAEIIAVNPAAESLFGLSAADLMGRSLESVMLALPFIQENGSVLAWENFPAWVTARTGKAMCDVMVGARRADGTLVWLSANTLALISDGAVPPYPVATIFRDMGGSMPTGFSTKHLRLLEQQKLLETSLDGFWVARASDGRILETNEAFCRMVGYSRDELLTMRIADLEVNESPVEIAAHIQKIMAEGYDRFETRHRHKLGHPVDLEVSVSYSVSDGGVNFVFVRDITAFKQSEAALRASEQEFRSLAESSPDFIIRYDGEHRIRYLNGKLIQELKLASAQEVLGRHPLEVWPDGRFTAIDEAAKRAIEIRDKVSVEFCVPGESGDMGFHQILVVPEYDAAGNIIGTLAFGRDATEYKRMEEAAISREREFRSLAEHTPDNIIRYNREGRTVYVNPEVKKVLGDSASRMIGMTVREYHSHDGFEDYARLVESVLSSGKSGEIEKVLPAPDGMSKAVHHIRMTPEYDENGAVIGVLAIGRDITELKQAERQLREYSAHLLAVREEEKIRLAREIHDDLGGTLAALNLRLSHLLDFGLSKDMKKTPLHTQLVAMSQILESAFAATRRIIGGMRSDVLDNLGLFEALKWQAEQFYKNNGIECHLVCSGDRGCLGCKDCEYEFGETLSINLFRIFQETLTNVARHSGASKVEATFHPSADEVVLYVSDNGGGMLDGESVSQTSYGMRGMRERVAYLGGEIEFDSPAGSGLRVTVRLPRAVVNRVASEYSGAM